MLNQATPSSFAETVIDFDYGPDSFMQSMMLFLQLKPCPIGRGIECFLVVHVCSLHDCCPGRIGTNTYVVFVHQALTVANIMWYNIGAPIRVYPYWG